MFLVGTLFGIHSYLTSVHKLPTTKYMLHAPICNFLLGMILPNQHRMSIRQSTMSLGLANLFTQLTKWV